MEVCSVLPARDGQFPAGITQNGCSATKGGTRGKALVAGFVAARLPGWMNFDFSKLARVERCVRDVSYAELREIAHALETSIAELDAHVTEVLGAKATAGHGRPRKRQ
jgi:hypothetical protein